MELTASTVGKGIVAIGGSGAGGYGIYSLAAGRATRASELSDQQTTQDTSSEVSTPAVPNFLFQVAGFGGETGDYSKDGGSFGYAFGRFMLNPDENSELWKKEKEITDDESETLNPSSSEFQAARNTEGDGNARFKEVCRDTYKKTKTTVISSGPLWLDTWKFCSVVDYPLDNVKKANLKVDGSDNDNYKNKWARWEGNADALFDVSDSDDRNNNLKAWNHIYKNILEIDKKDSSKRKGLDQIFQTIDSGNKLSEECKKSYGYDSTDSETNYGKNVREYCVLDLSVALSNYPTYPTK